MKKAVRHLVLAIVLALFAAAMGCASSSSVSNAMKPTADLTSFKTVAVKVENRTDASADEQKLLKEQIEKKLRESGKWQAVEVGEITVTATITDISRVGGASRLLLGAFAGRAGTKADVLVAQKTGAIITTFSVEGKSGGGSTFSGGTDQSIEKAAEKIVEQLQN